MKWLEDIKYKLWWRGITVKDLLLLALMPLSIIGIVIFALYVFGLSV